MQSLPSGLSVVIPAYRSGGTLGVLVERLARVLPALAADFEVIIVNDGSDDDTWAAVCRLAAAHGFVRGIDLLRNYGQQNALLCGIRAARYDRTITMDDDLQHPPETLPELVAALRPDRDVVYAAPQRERHGWRRDLASGVTKFAWACAMRGRTTRKASSWRIFRTGLRESFVSPGGSAVSIDVLLAWGTARFDVVTVAHAPRAQGKSNYTAAKLLRHALSVTIGVSPAPLRFAGAAGLGLLVSAWLAPFRGDGRPILFVAGVLLLAVGILGEYFARRSRRKREKTAYVVRAETAARSPSDSQR